MSRTVAEIVLHLTLIAVWVFICLHPEHASIRWPGGEIPGWAVGIVAHAGIVGLSIWKRSQ